MTQEGGEGERNPVNLWLVRYLIIFPDFYPMSFIR